MYTGGEWNLIYVIVSIILTIVGLSNYLLTQIQKSSECNEIILQLNREGEKLNEESKVINEKIDNTIDRFHHIINSMKTFQILHTLSNK